ncbi:MAG TPA: hypothetical protein VN645_02095, partial [Steroidobacteraceae bacterium]|nr:hypothetical protein [Steroidobacteraceae bacterium]
MNPPSPTVTDVVERPTTLQLIGEREYTQWMSTQPAALQDWLRRSGYRPEPGRWILLPSDATQTSTVLAGTGSGVPDAQQLLWLAAALGDGLPVGEYALAQEFGDARDELFALGWMLGGYRFARYRGNADTASLPRLRRPRGVVLRDIAAAASATALARDLINTPANDLGPAELEVAALALADRAGGKATVISGTALTSGYPLVAAVGQGSVRAPRLIELRFPRRGAPKLALVGKGVCFDTGGLDIKQAAGMLLMKKDMGGAACVLALTEQLRALDVAVDLRVLIPAVENAVDGAAFRPGDVWRSRKGLTVEIGNTDAEGRLVLADALQAASEEKPDLLIDFATLTGA